MKRLFLSTILAFLMSGCISKGPENVKLTDVKEWFSYSNSLIGYNLIYPSNYTLHEYHDGKDAIFRYHGYPIIVVNYVDEREGKDRGLWVKQDPKGNILLGGKTGKKYEYTHYDAVFGMPVQSFVVEHKGNLLGIEFRKEGDLDPVLSEVLSSFAFKISQ